MSVDPLMNQRFIFLFYHPSLDREEHGSGGRLPGASCMGHIATLPWWWLRMETCWRKNSGAVKSLQGKLREADKKRKKNRARGVEQVGSCVRDFRRFWEFWEKNMWEESWEEGVSLRLGDRVFFLAGEDENWERGKEWKEVFSTLRKK